MSGNQFIQTINGKQMLVSFHGIRQEMFVHGTVVEAMGNKYLVRMNFSNGPLEGYEAEPGSYARPMHPKNVANWVSIYEWEAA